MAPIRFLCTLYMYVFYSEKLRCWCVYKWACPKCQYHWKYITPQFPFFFSLGSTVSVKLRFPIVLEGVVAASSLRRALTRLRCAALLLESLSHSQYFGEDITRWCRTPLGTDCLVNLAGDRKKGSGGHGLSSRSPAPSCSVAGRGSLCARAEWSFCRWTLRTGLASTNNTNCSTWCSHCSKGTVLISGLDLSVSTVTMSDQNYYWTVLPSYKTSFVTGAMMKRSKR